MNTFLDAIADARFVPQGDDSVRVMVSEFYGTGFDLSAAQSDGTKLLWRPLVRCYIHAAHACALLGLFVPWAGLALLFLLWIVKSYLVHGMRRRSGREVSLERGEFDRVYEQLSRSISRRAAISLGIVAAIPTLPFAISGLLPLFTDHSIETLPFLALFFVGLGWGGLF